MSAPWHKIQMYREVSTHEISHSVDGSSHPACSERAAARALAAAASLATLMCLAGCATDRLEPAAPKGVDLSGEWKLNPNLSDDIQAPPPADTNSGETRHHRGSGSNSSGGGMPPFVNPGGGTGGVTSGASPPGTNDFTNNADVGGGTFVPTLWQYPGGGMGGPGGMGGRGGWGGPPGGGAQRGGSDRPRANFGHWLDAPDRMKIEQNGGKLTIQSNMPGGELKTDELVSGHASNVPIGQSTAERDVGWRDTMFVINTKVKSGPTLEQDYGLDENGRLIVSTFLSGGHMPKTNVNRVYDRVTGAPP